jgi:hypothetical protein
MTTTIENSLDFLDAERPYLSYWPDYAPGDPDAERIARVEQRIAAVALRGESTPEEFDRGPIDIGERIPALQAEMWYRLVGPLNDLEGAEPDLEAAIDLMGSAISKEGKIPTELALDRAYALTDLANLKSSPESQKQDLKSALEVIHEIETHPGFKDQELKYQLNAKMLKYDLLHSATRLRHSGDINVKPLEVADYRKYEQDFVKLELLAAQEFTKFIYESSAVDQSFGTVFEWFVSMDRRHRAWAEENIDTVSVHGATSRQDGSGWKTSQGKTFTAPKSGNHDIIIESYRPDREPEKVRIQLKVPDKEKFMDQYDQSVVNIIDLRDVLKLPPEKKDLAVAAMRNELKNFARDYIQA